jgi:Rhodopirellula transposase DDE domain
MSESILSQVTLMIAADSGGSNGYRIRLWKVELQKVGQHRAPHWSLKFRTCLRGSRP